MWDASYSGKGATVPFMPWDRGNASGDKITSNAHSGDFPGLYFYWNDKQKDDGVLLVAESTFDLFKANYTYELTSAFDKKVVNKITVECGFILTAKNSNMYYGWVIEKSMGNIVGQQNGENVYAYAIPKSLQFVGKNNKTEKDDLKNINMVFIDGVYKSAFFEIEKVWQDKDGNVIPGDDSLVSFKEGWKLDKVNEVKITDYKSAAFGKKVTVTENPIEGFTCISANPQSLVVKYNDDPIQVVTVVNRVVPPVITSGILEIAKTVDGVPFLEWAEENGLSAEEIADIQAGMVFKAFPSDEDGNYDEEGDFIIGEWTDEGTIDFGIVDIGWYVVVEELSGTSLKVFASEEGVVTNLFYVGTSGTSASTVSFISGKDFGVVVSHDGTGVNYQLPGVWDGVLAGQPAYEALKAMGAQWVWSCVDTYQFGTTGDVYLVTFKFSSTEDGTTPAYLAADNAAVVYVNGKLAGWTEVAFSTPGNDPAEDLADFNFGALTADIFSGGWADGWNYSYEFDIDYIAGENVITIIAANSAWASDGPNSSYNEQTNPCGLLFGFEIVGATFNNTFTGFEEEHVCNGCCVICDDPDCENYNIEDCDHCDEEGLPYCDCGCEICKPLPPFTPVVLASGNRCYEDGNNTSKGLSFDYVINGVTGTYVSGSLNAQSKGVLVNTEIGGGAIRVLITAGDFNSQGCNHISFVITALAANVSVSNVVLEGGSKDCSQNN